MRVKTGTVRRAGHKKVLKAAKGFWMTRHKRFKVANQAVMHAGRYAFIGRRLRRRDMRKVWIVRINSLLKASGVRYSDFIKKMTDKKVTLNRKMLADIATNDSTTFTKIVNFVK